MDLCVCMYACMYMMRVKMGALENLYSTRMDMEKVIKCLKHAIKFTALLACTGTEKRLRERERENGSQMSIKSLWSTSRLLMPCFPIHNMQVRYIHTYTSAKLLFYGNEIITGFVVL